MHSSAKSTERHVKKKREQNLNFRDSRRPECQVLGGSGLWTHLWHVNGQSTYAISCQARAAKILGVSSTHENVRGTLPEKRFFEKVSMFATLLSWVTFLTPR